MGTMRRSSNNAIIFFVTFIENVDELASKGEVFYLLIVFFFGGGETKSIRGKEKNRNQQTTNVN